jgi:hypothetical protein
VLGGRAVRADVAERAAAHLVAARSEASEGGERDDTHAARGRVASWLGCAARDLPRVVRDLMGCVREA